jgi:hypothetical protein
MGAGGCRQEVGTREKEAAACRDQAFLSMADCHLQIGFGLGLSSF